MNCPVLFLPKYAREAASDRFSVWKYLPFVFVVRRILTEFVDHLFNDHFFYIYIETQNTDKRKKFQKILILFRSIGESIL